MFCMYITRGNAELTWPKCVDLMVCVLYLLKNRCMVFQLLVRLNINSPTNGQISNLLKASSLQ